MKIFMTRNVSSLKTDHVHNSSRLIPFIVLDSYFSQYLSSLHIPPPKCVENWSKNKSTYRQNQG